MTAATEPAWVTALRELAAQTSQAQAAKLIKYSGPVVNAVLRGNYPADTGNVQKAVEAYLAAARVDCQYHGFEISRVQCLKSQRRAPSGASPMGLQIYDECRRGCPHFVGGGKNAQR